MSRKLGAIQSGNSFKILFHHPRYDERTCHGRAALKGREARRYFYRLFIRYERQLKAVSVDVGVQGQLPSAKSAKLQRSLVTLKSKQLFTKLSAF